MEAHRVAGSNGSIAPPMKKLTIKPLKAKPALPADFEETTWAKLQDAVAAVHAKQPVATSLEELYRAVEDLCMHKLGEGVYRRLAAACDAHVASALAALAAHGPEPIAYLRAVERAWADHTAATLTLRSIFLYLDRTYVLQVVGAKPLWDLGLSLFRTHLAAAPDVEKRCVSGLLACVRRERDGEAIDRGLLKALVRMMAALGVYATGFEKPFLAEAGSYYESEAARYLASVAVPEYLQHAERRLAEEAERCAACLEPGTKRAVLVVAESALVAAHATTLLDRGFASLMAAHRLPDLQRMHMLLSRVGCLDALKAAWGAWVRAAGLELVKDEEKDKELVALLLALKSRLDVVLERCMGGADGFAAALKDSFEFFINSRANRPAELIAKFLDSLLRSGNKGTSEEELESTLDRALVLFRYIQGKDVFEAFYKKDLARRLLLGKSASIDAEKSMISKLKAECGAQFTNKLEGMFKDIDLSRDVMASFRQSAVARSRLPAGSEVAVHVLTTGYWPSYAPMELRLPAELALYQEVFREFYLAKHTGRRLLWHHPLGHCVLKARFPAGVKELSVSLFQAVILLLFNAADSLTLADLREASGLEDKELRRTLQSLACGKVRVLLKSPPGREVDDGDAFAFNEEFTEKLYRLKVNSIQMKETVEEQTSTHQAVFVDRQYQVDAAVVRVMKTRKSLAHAVLMSELFQQLKFPVKAADLKKRIESLIDREYLERDASNPTIYKYLA